MFFQDHTWRWKIFEKTLLTWQSFSFRCHEVCKETHGKGPARRRGGAAESVRIKSKLGFTATPVQAMAWKTLAYHQKNLYIYSIYQRDPRDFRFMYRHNCFLMLLSLLLPPWSVECSSSDCQSSQAKRPKSGPRRINKLLKSSWQIKLDTKIQVVNQLF